MFQFRPPLQLQQKWGNCTASKSWHGASEEIKCHWHLLRLSVATAQVATLNLPRRKKAEPQEPVGKAFYQHERFCMLKSVDVKIIGWSTDGKCHMDSAHVASATKLSSNIRVMDAEILHTNLQVNWVTCISKDAHRVPIHLYKYVFCFESRVTKEDKPPHSSAGREAPEAGGAADTGTALWDSRQLPQNQPQGKFTLMATYENTVFTG